MKHIIFLLIINVQCLYAMDDSKRPYLKIKPLLKSVMHRTSLSEGDLAKAFHLINSMKLDSPKSPVSHATLFIEKEKSIQRSIQQAITTDSIPAIPYSPKKYIQEKRDFPRTPSPLFLGQTIC